MSKLQTVRILSVEDNPADARMIEELFKLSKIKTELTSVEDGDAAMDYLLRRGAYSKATRPDVILLDLNLPGKDGLEVLKEVKEHPDLKSIPILVLSTSTSDRDVRGAYELYANCYFSKPSDLNQFDETMKAIEDCWFKLAELPARRVS